MKLESMGRWLLSFLILFMGGCKSSKPTYDLEKIVPEVQKDCEDGYYENSIQRLENLDIYHQPQLLELLAFAYEANKNLFKSAQTFSQAFYSDLHQNYTEDILYAAQIYKQLHYNEAAACCYRHYIDHFTKDAEAWFALSDIEKQLEHWNAALVAFLNGISLKDEISPEESYQLARLCQKAELQEAAEFWFIQSLKTTTNPRKPLKQLLKLALSRKDRNKVQKLIASLEKHVNGFFNHEPWKSVRETYLPQLVLQAKPVSMPSREVIQQTLHYFCYPNYPSFKDIHVTFINFYSLLP